MLRVTLLLSMLEVDGGYFDRWNYRWSHCTSGGAEEHVCMNSASVECSLDLIAGVQEHYKFALK